MHCLFLWNKKLLVQQQLLSYDSELNVISFWNCGTICATTIAFKASKGIKGKNPIINACLIEICVTAISHAAPIMSITTAPASDKIV